MSKKTLRETIGVSNIFLGDKKDESKTLPSDILVDPSSDEASEPSNDPQVGDSQEKTSDNAEPAPPSEPEASEPSSNADASENEGESESEGESEGGGESESEGESESGWVDWNVTIDSRFMVADIVEEDGFFGSPAELLPFVFRVFQAVLNDGTGEDKRAALGALKFLTDHYQEFHGAQPQMAPPAPAPAPAPVPQPEPAPQPITTNSRSESAQPEIKIPESLKEMAQADTKSRQSLPTLARGYIDDNGCVHGYPEFRDAGFPAEWDEQVVWRTSDGIYTNMRVSERSLVDDFVRGKKMDPIENPTYANAAQKAQAEWQRRCRR